MDKRPSQLSKGAQLGIIIGAVLILIGIVKFLERFFGSSWWGAIEQFFGTLFSFVWPVALIGAGVYLVWAAQTGKFKGARIDTSRPLRRSMIDKRIAGVCGGIAQYIGIDSTMVRVLAVIIFVVWPGPTFLLYLLGAVLMPKA